MITLEKLRLDMENQFKKDREIKFVDIHADSLEEALADAAIQLQSKVSFLEYEVLEQGYKGFMSLMKKPWVLRVYENPSLTKRTERSAVGNLADLDTLNEIEVIKDIDGAFYIRRFLSEIHVKIVPPQGKGQPVDYNVLIENLQRSDTSSINDALIKRLVKNSTHGKYEPVGEYTHNPSGDATFYVEMSSDEMKASIIATAPSIGGADISEKRIEQMLQAQGITNGTNKEKVEEFVDNPVYGIPVVVAEGVEAVDGNDAYISYNFETDNSKVHMTESASGQVDYKELNLIQNVVEGQPLAQKMLPEKGKPGRTLLGRYLEAKNGKDIALPLGKNVRIDTDGRTIVADINGQVLLINDKIHVEPVMEVDGVNIKTGNITFLGTIIIKGNVEDGFHVKASGNVEIYGTVGNSVVEADGDIIVSLGVMGKDQGLVRSGKSMWAKFIQNATVEAEEFIVVRDGIINSNVTSNKKIFVHGKRASIIGGHLFATEEIRAKTIGNNAGASETILSVGYDPKAKKRLDELTETQANLIKELNEIELDIQTLEQQKKIRKTLPPEKEESLANFMNRKQEIHHDVDEMSAEIQEIQDHLRELKVVGTVSASGAVYPGVKINIRDVREDIRNETKAVTFFYEDGFVRYGKYEQASSADEVKVPDGYSTH